MTDSPAEIPPAAQSRQLIRSAERAALATVADKGKCGAGGPWPYASLVLVACGHDASPLLLISDLADHTVNLRADPRVSLLYDGTAGLAEPLTGPRVSLQGEAEMTGCEALKARYLRRHPSAGVYAEFMDFHLFRVRPARAHLVAGFGRIDWVEADDLMYDLTAAPGFSEDEPAAIEALNENHRDLLDLAVGRLSGRRSAGWNATGLDPEGIDLRRGGASARLDFATPVAAPDGAVAMLRRMAGDA